ncbi:phage tail length tape measure family protein, partial [Halomonas sp. SIMBA_159]
KLIDDNDFKLYNTRIQQMRDQVGKASVDFNKNGVSAKQMQAALRGVPAQFTDIAVSLQGGQNPLTVFLQQGGQLKDMFG